MYTPVRLLTADFSSDMIAVGRQWGQHVLIAGSKNSNKNLISRILYPANYLSQMKVKKDILR